MGKKSLKLLFIGNSFTARNNLPGLIAKLAEPHGIAIEHKLLSIGGAPLRLHWNKGEALKEIQGGSYDYVVLQEQSTLPAKNPTRMRESVRLFDEPIRAAGAKMVLYMTWARRHAPETQQKITDAYTSIGHEFGAIVVPVGIAWQKFLAGHEKPVLHDKDGSHPSLAGSYLAACVFVQTLFGKTDFGSGEATGLAAADAKLLQRAGATPFA